MGTGRGAGADRLTPGIALLTTGAMGDRWAITVAGSCAAITVAGSSSSSSSNIASAAAKASGSKAFSFSRTAL